MNIYLMVSLILVILVQSVFLTFIRLRKKENGKHADYYNQLMESELLSSGSQIDIAINMFNCKDRFGSSSLEVATLSARGSGHLDQKVPNQDSFVSFQFNEYLIVALSDGVSNSPKSHVGSKLLTSNLRAAVETHIQPNAIDSKQDWAAVNEALTREMLAEYLKRNGKKYLDSEITSTNVRVDAAKYFAATLEVLVVSRAPTTDENYGKFFFIRIAGDGSVLLLDEKCKTFRLVSADQEATKVKSSHRVSALPLCDLAPEIYIGQITAGQRLLFMTDGLGDQSFKSTFQNELRASLGLRQNPNSLMSFVLGDSVQTSDDRTISILRLI